MKLVLAVCILVSVAVAMPFTNLQRAQLPAHIATKPANNEQMVRHINAQDTTWKAGFNARLHGLTMKHMADLCGTHLVPKSRLPPAKRYAENVALPDNFDPRDQWTDCKSLKVVRDQGGCGSCWAFGGVEAMTDRLCIANNGTLNPPLSTEQVTACCNSQYSDVCWGSDGCDGGQVGEPWDYYQSVGIVTGGLYGDDTTCLPYSIEPCEHHMVGPRENCSEHEHNTPTCKKECKNGAVFSKDKHYGQAAYSLDSVDDIMQDLYKHGPIEAAFSVYEDFMAYKSGVYQHKSGGMLGGHAIKIMGWGVEEGTKYWLVANSWNTDWGMDGFFKILRGSDECGIESNCVGGLPA